MLLCDSEIQRALREGVLTIDPEPLEERYDATGVDLTLDDEFLIWSLDELRSQFGRVPEIEIGAFDWSALVTAYTVGVPLNQNGCVVLEPNHFMLGLTAERLEFPPHLAGRVEGKSSLARLGLSVHFAPTLHANWAGQITLELHNVGPAPLSLRPGAAICQLLVEQVEGTPTASMVGTRFQDQDSPRGPSAET